MVKRLRQTHPTAGVVLEQAGDEVKQLPVVVILGHGDVPVEGLAVLADVPPGGAPLVPVHQLAVVVVLSPSRKRKIK